MSTETAFSGDLQSEGGQSSANQFADPLSIRSMELSMREHLICFVVPAGAKIDALTLDLPGGMLVLGALRGKVNCAAGSLIIAQGGEFQGVAEATDIFIEGKVSSQLIGGTGGERTRLKARGRVTQGSGGISTTSGGIIAVSTSANISGHLQARSYHIPLKADLKRVYMETI